MAATNIRGRQSYITHSATRVFLVRWFCFAGQFALVYGAFNYFSMLHGRVCDDLSKKPSLEGSQTRLIKFQNRLQ